MAEQICITGQVQGVGFRPFVWRLAQRYDLCGQVWNDAAGVTILARGAQIDAFVRALGKQAPPLSRIDTLTRTPHAGPLADGFTILPSRGGAVQAGIVPDMATCPTCLDDITTPGRRQDYAFTNCTNCGPRFTILTGLPYDRAQTTMAGFAMCPDCTYEYGDPTDRRFHAQPNACPACGPQLSLDGDPHNAIARAAAALTAGGLVAIKGLGGVHLACDARNLAAIARLRRLKSRPTKPLALMGTLQMVHQHSGLTAEGRILLSSPVAPIVLLPRPDILPDTLPDTLAPGLDRLGWMLPATPLHHLVLAAVDGPLVMTSANATGEPMAISTDDLRADAVLDHNRDIARRLDDSVMALGPRGPMVIRRARGLVPATRALPPGFEDAPQVLALGGQMKSAICLLRDGRAMLGHHLGDLDRTATVQAFEAAITDYTALLDARPDRIACDLHPEFHATRVAERLTSNPIRVQHHHAHLAACLGDARWPIDGGPVAGIILDGLGYGPDGTVWGGELLLGDYRSFTRIAHLAPAPLPGGDAAARDPWRNLLVRLDQAGLGDLADRLLPDHPRDLIRQAVAKGLNAPLSSSTGRLFDAFAAALGLHDQTYEGEAAMRLETLARQAGPVEPWPMPGFDPAPMFQAFATSSEPSEVLAARFHESLAQAFAAAARALVDGGRAKAVALSGGCFQNTFLMERTLAALQGVPVLTHSDIPANDGGLAFGQALVAAAKSG